ncbi:hypothetical protein EW146_g7004 [Bondarzewia mesenterica]|uniref:FAD-binding PCMH-type domain-containing protein n=1 Tax=Bondarzewia mesenterica TaxID=1095465 RepID=A0A4S4LNY0_9AGAM|nr:hypothetical protein EW146_g7004 [Bondarzewia mesenterica]
MTDIAHQLQGKIEGNVLSPMSPGYSEALRRNSDLSVLEAACVAQPAVYTDISTIISFASSRKLEIAVKGGGCHSSTWSSSQGGVVIDLSILKKVTLSKDRSTVIVQGGANWGDVYELGSKEGFEVVGAPLWFVGVGGSLLGGAYGNLTAEHGLGLDNMVAAKVVLADGRIIDTSVTKEPDLFWAIRGGGCQFGIVVEFVLRTFPSPGPSTIGSLVYSGTVFPDVLKVIQEFVTTATVHEKVGLMFTRPAPHFQPTVVVTPWISGATTRSTANILAPFRSDIAPLIDKVTSAPDQLIVSHASDAALSSAPRRLIIRGVPFIDLWTDMMLEVWTRWCKFTEEHEDARRSTVIWDTRKSEKVAEVRREDTAFCVRYPHYSVAIQGRNSRPETDEVSRAFVTSTAAFIRQTNIQKTGHDLGLLLNMAQGDEPAEAVFGLNLAKLRKLKAKYDPERMWTKGFVIDSDVEESKAESV